MFIKRNDYLKTLVESKTLRAEELTRYDTGLEKYLTANPVHARHITAAVKQLKGHFDNKDVARPFNCVLLGGPGSGKNYLAEQFSQAVQAEWIDFNLSQFFEAREIADIFLQVEEKLRATKSQRLLVFLDEFDVRVGSSAAIQYLIQPIYDGKMRHPQRELEFRRVAFLYSGSYLASDQVFNSVVGADEQVDLLRLLYDVGYNSRQSPYASEYHKDLWRTLIAAVNYMPIKQAAFRNRGAIQYVRALEKVRDFVSRMNGFVVELRDLSSPLDTARPRFRVEIKAGEKDLDTVIANRQVTNQMYELVDGYRKHPEEPRFFAYPNPNEPILEYKNLILIDRLGMVLTMLRKDGIKKMTRELLNYLVVAPLIHGARSLKTVIEALVRVGDGSPTMPLDEGVLLRNIAEFRQFGTPTSVWTHMACANPTRLTKANPAEIVTIN